MSAVIPDPALTDWVPLWSLGAPSGLVMIEDKLLGANAAEFDFANIPQTYKHLELRGVLRGTAATWVAECRVLMNGDVTASYDSYVAQLAGAFSMPTNLSAAAYGVLAFTVGANQQANRFSAVRAEFPDYASTDKMKVWQSQFGQQDPGQVGLSLGSGGFRKLPGITRLQIQPNTGLWLAGSRLTLYALTDVTAPPAVWTPPTYGTSLPGSPADGQEHTLVDSLTNPTYQWRFRYNAGNSTAYKWEFIGGTPINKEEAAAFVTTSASYVDPTTTPSFIVPRAGVYDVHFGAAGNMSTNDTGYIALYVGGASDALGVYMFRGDQGAHVNDRHMTVGPLVASALLKLQQRYAPSTGGSSFGTRNRFMHITPVRVS